MTSKLSQMQARFQQKQIQEKEEKLLRLYETQQQRAFERVGRSSAGSNTSSLGSTGGKVRQMFDERRQRAGIDKSYPLEPLKSSNKSPTVNKNVATSRTVVKSSTSSVKKSVNNNKFVNKREAIQAIYTNNNGNENYQENYYNGNIVDDVMVRNGGGSHHQSFDILDNEQMPDEFGFDDVDNDDDQIVRGKLTNLGGKLPSEAAKNVGNNKEKASGVSLPLGKTFRKETKPIVKRTVRPVISNQTASPTSSAAAKSNTNSTNSPVSPEQSTMQKSVKPTAKKSPSAPSKTPSNARPSAKQVPKSPVVRDDLAECRYCSRRFATDRLGVHEEICAKTAKKKRKTYDATKHRIEGTDIEPFVRRGGGAGRGARPAARQQQQTASKKDWRKTHEEFINAIRSAKQAQAHLAKGGKLADLPPPPPSSNPDYVQCPHCGRKFNEAAAERHIPKCATYEFNKPKPGQAKGRVGR